MELLSSIGYGIIGLIAVGVIARVIFCAVACVFNPDEREVYMKRMLHALIFGAFAIVIFQIKDQAQSFFR